MTTMMIQKPTRRAVYARYIATVLSITTIAAEPPTEAVTPEAQAQAMGHALDAFNRRAMLADAQALMRAGEHGRAVPKLVEAVKQWPNAGDAHRLLGLAYFELKKMDDARTSLTNAVAFGRGTPAVLTRLIQLHQHADAFGPALDTIRLATVVDPHNTELQLMQGDYAMTVGAFGDAKARFRELIEHHPNDPALWLRLGNVAMQEQRPDEALTCFETAYRLGATEPNIVTLLAELSVQLDDIDGALSWYEAVATQQPERAAEINLRRAQIDFSRHQFERAATIAQSLLSEPEHAASAHQLLARIAMEKGNVDAANVHLDAASASGLESPEVLSFLGNHRYHKGEFATAIDFYKRSLQLDPEQRPIRANLISCLLNSDAAAAANSALVDYVSRYGIDDTAARFVERLSRQQATE